MKRPFWKDALAWTYAIAAIFCVEIFIASRGPHSGSGMSGIIDMASGAILLAIVAEPIAALSYRFWFKR